MGWDGLGGNLFSGLQSGSGNAYNTKPWFNSWQIEVRYNMIEIHRLKAFFGIGYESDVFLFDNGRNSFIYLSGSSQTLQVADAVYFATANLPNDEWETRLCTRYITFPIGLSYDQSEDFGVELSLLPSINFTTNHTGLKYNLNGDNISHLRDPLKGHIRPLKLDIRLGIKFWITYVFMQISPISVFKDMDRNAYPMRFGFMIKI